MSKSVAALRCMFCLVLCLAGCHGGQLRLRVSEHSSRFVWRDPVSCEQFKDLWRGLLYPARPPLGYAEGRQQAAEGFVLNAQMRWNDHVRALAGMSELICQQHNEEQVTLREFERGRLELEEAAAGMADLRKELDDAFQEHRTARDQMERARVSEHESQNVAAVRDRLDAVARQVEAILEQAGALVAGLRGDVSESAVLASML